MTDHALYLQVYRERFGSAPEHERVTDADRRRHEQALETARRERLERGSRGRR